LITLGIIGIVAVLTMPALMANYQKKVTETRLKHFHSVFSQAWRLAEVEHGEPSGWKFPTSGSFAQVQEYFKTYVEPYVKVASYQGSKTIAGVPYFANNSNASAVRFSLANGTMIALVASPSGGIVVFADTNGAGKPNQYGADVFKFVSSGGAYTYSVKKSGTMDVSNRDELLYYCTIEPECCTALLSYDGWEIKDDYPW
jgi:type II secretory pathway pseudopilin PulG